MFGLYFSFKKKTLKKGQTLHWLTIANWLN